MLRPLFLGLSMVVVNVKFQVATVAKSNLADWAWIGFLTSVDHIVGLKVAT